jgi:shikimate dehydrogenase
MHAAAYAALGIDATYEAIPASRADLAALVRRLARGELSGLNVTVPHKRAALECADVVDASAARVGGANTLVRAPDGEVSAHNTDVDALAEELRGLSAAADRSRSVALVLGTGATARSAVMALARNLDVGAVVVRGRGLGDARRRGSLEEELAEIARRARSGVTLRFEPWGPAASTDREASVIVQATSAGMEGGDPGDVAAAAVDWARVSSGAVALDVVYARTTTPFLRAAEARGLRGADGHGMLARQGALAFQLWLQREAPLAAMRAALAQVRRAEP